MGKRYHNLISKHKPSLIWLNRKRVWAGTTRETSSGVTQIPTNPSTTTGQQSKPNVSHRQFLLSLSWAIRACLTSASLSLAALLGLSASKEAWSSTLGGASHLTDTVKNGANNVTGIGTALSILKFSLTPNPRSPIFNVKGLLSIPAAFARYALFALGYSDTPASQWGLPWGWGGKDQSRTLAQWARIYEITRPRCMLSSVVRNFTKTPFHRQYQIQFEKMRYREAIVCTFTESEGLIFGNKTQAKCYTSGRQSPSLQGGLGIDINTDAPNLAPTAQGTIKKYQRYTKWDI